MALDQSATGRRGITLVYDVEAGHVGRFAKAVGDPSPVYQSLEAAKQAGHPAIPAPPTFFTALKPDEGIRDGLDMDWSRILHGSEEVVYQRPIYVGDRVYITPVIDNIYDKKGRSGHMEFLVLRTEARDSEGELVYAVKRTVIVKRRTP